jgi:cellulose synthase/poly-beta-1,6-N-acetylglucosamine synthase-like glycosyltransferase
MSAYFFIQLLLQIVLGISTLYILVFSVAGLFYRQKPYVKSLKIRKIAVLIPGYKEDKVILESVKSALEQTYPIGKFDVVVIADSFQPETMMALHEMPIKLIEVSFDNSTKAKALNAGMKTLDNHYDIAVILDADNIMAPDFLFKINSTFEKGFIAVQGHRKSKNQNTQWAIMDTVSEEINNHIFRKGHRVMGLSSAIIGSGMAFQYSFFKMMMLSVNAIGGFDKEIELKMLKDKIKIEYLDDACVYDEKVQETKVFANQRRRWLAAQLHYFKTGMPDAFLQLITKGNLDYFDKAFQFILPPRILLLGANFLFGVLFTLLNMYTKSSTDYSIIWWMINIACIGSIVFAIPAELKTRQTWQAVKSLPRGMWVMLLSLLRIRNANKKFIHTQHGTDSAKSN